MKLITLMFLAAFFSTTGVAATKPANWICEVKDPNWPWPKKSKVHISLTEPTVTRVDFIEESDGNYKPNSDELITKTTVSTYKADKAKCNIIDSCINKCP